MAHRRTRTARRPAGLARSLTAAVSTVILAASTAAQHDLAAGAPLPFPVTVDHALGQLGDPNLRAGAVTRLEQHGFDAVPALERELRAWLRGQPSAPLWTVIWVVGRIGPTAGACADELDAVLSHAGRRRDGGLATQAAWALAEIARPADAMRHAAHLAGQVNLWQGTPTAHRLQFACAQVGLIADPELPRRRRWLDREPDLRFGLGAHRALLAWRLRRGGSGDPDFDAATVADLCDAWRGYAAHDPLGDGRGPETIDLGTAEVAVTLLLRDDLPADPDLRRMMRAASTYFDPVIRAEALAAFADRAAGVEPSFDVCDALRRALVDDHPPVRMEAIRGWVQFGGAPALIAGWAAVAEREPEHAPDALAQARRLAEWLGDGTKQLVELAIGDEPGDLAAVVARWPGLRPIVHRWNALAAPTGWGRWLETAWRLGVAEPGLVPELWPAMVDSIAFVDADGIAERCAAIASLDVAPDRLAARLAAAVVQREPGLDLAPVFATLALLGIDDTTSDAALLEVVATGDVRARLRAIELLEQRPDPSVAVRDALRCAVAAEHPSELRLGRHVTLDIAGRIAVREAAERALQALTR